MERLKHDVIGTMQLLAATASGSRGGDSLKELDALREWLEWRVNDGWYPEKPTTLIGAYERTIRTAAALAVGAYTQWRQGQSR